MTTQIGFRNQRYDDHYPHYVEVTPGWVVRQDGGSMIEKDSLLAAMAAEGYTEKPHEVAPSIAWNETHRGPWSSMEPGSIPLSQVKIREKNVPGQKVELQIATGHSGIDKAGTVTVTFAIDGGTDVQFTVAANQDDNGHAICQAVAGAAEWAANGVTATVSGASIELDAGAGKEITKLTATIA